MGEGGFVVIMIVAPFVLIAIGIAVYYAWKAEQERKTGLQALAEEFGLRFISAHDKTHDERYANFEIFRRGHSRSAYNSLFGSIEISGSQHGLVMGDFTYKVTSSNGKSSSTTTYRFSYLILHPPLPGVPDLLIRHEHLLDKIGSALGFDDIDFESAEFSRKFMVSSPDKRFAYDVVTPRMMEFLLGAGRIPIIDLECGMLCLSDGSRRWKPEEFREKLRFAETFFSLWPEHVVRDLQTRAT